MEKLFLIMFSFCLFIASSFSQEIYTDSISKKEIKKLAFLSGNWEGEGWMMDPNGERHSFQQTENVEFKLDSTSILIEGRGFANRQIVHDALAIVRYDKENKRYSFSSFLANGRGGNFYGEIKDQEFHWYPGQNMRYIIKVDGNQWAEIGEMNRNGEWMQFFQMNLTKK